MTSLAVESAVANPPRPITPVEIAVDHVETALALLAQNSSSGSSDEVALYLTIWSDRPRQSRPNSPRSRSVPSTNPGSPSLSRVKRSMS
jgi:hypothetical protein